MAVDGFDHTGRVLIELAAERFGVSDFGASDVLDVGCGVRFAAAIVNGNIPVRSYTGVEVDRRIVDYLGGELSRDARFRFLHWDVRNAMYNPGGVDLAGLALPVEGRFDAIWLFSVVTHLEPADAGALFAMLRDRVRPNGKMLFTAFISDGDGFEDREPEHPLRVATYGVDLLTSLVERAAGRSIQPGRATGLATCKHISCARPPAKRFVASPEGVTFGRSDEACVTAKPRRLRCSGLRDFDVQRERQW